MRLPYNYDERVVTKLVKLAVKIARSTDPKIVVNVSTWHDTSKMPWLSAHHGWLMKGSTQASTVEGFVCGLLGRAARPNERTRIDKALGDDARKPIPTATQATRARSEARKPRRERTDGEAKAKLRERIEFWTEKLKTAERDARKARKTLRSLRASDRALDKKLVNVDPSTTDDATLAETLRARRG